MVIACLHIFKTRRCRKKNHCIVGFCYQRREKVLSSDSFARMWILTNKIKMESLIDDDLEKSLSDESDSGFDNDSNDKYNK